MNAELGSGCLCPPRQHLRLLEPHDRQSGRSRKDREQKGQDIAIFICGLILPRLARSKASHTKGVCAAIMVPLRHSAMAA